MKTKISIIGLGYVGLPLAVEFGKKYETIGFDVNKKRINELLIGFDNTGEISKRKLSSSIKLNFSDLIL
jgi:UDP-N-acetyl-D-galactosamine dehydrogenase